MHQESVILMKVLEELMTRRIVGLGLHDGLLVKTSVVDQVKTVMEEVGKEVTGAHLPVTIKPS